jgi:hypothetical protein
LAQIGIHLALHSKHHCCNPRSSLSVLSLLEDAVITKITCVVNTDGLMALDDMDRSEVKGVKVAGAGEMVLKFIYGFQEPRQSVAAA